MKETPDGSTAIVHNADPMDFLQGILSNPKDSLLTIASSSLKGMRDDNLKNRIVLALSGIANKGREKFDKFSDDSKFEIYDDLNTIFKAIESGDNVKKLKGKVSLYLWSLSEEDKDRVLTRKLMSIYDELSEDAILLLKHADDEDLIEFRSNSQDTFMIELAKKTGLGHRIFAQRGIEELTQKDLVTTNYTDVRNNVLTEIGNNLKERVEKYDIFSMPES